MQIIHNSYIFKRFQNERYETLIASLILKVKDSGTHQVETRIFMAVIIFRISPPVAKALVMTENQ